MTRAGSIWVFAGPSLPMSARPASDAFVWRPPALAGDGLAAIEAAPRVVVLIDGVFDRYPAIRHKELMALMDHGVHVIGGASMGALRAAELRHHGMVGVGAVFEAYARGRLIRDDEVAVLHGPVDIDWAALTLPLVNVRATLMRAVRDGVIGVEAARTLRERAADIFFQDRTWPVLIEAAHESVGPDQASRFADWAPRGYVDLKQRDARLCLAAGLAAASQPASPRVSQGQTAFTAALAAQVSSGSKQDLASSWRR